MKEPKITGIEYHRNGVCGRGFWAGDCEWEGDKLIVLRPSDIEARDDEGLEPRGTECFVVSREHGACCAFRGDCFAQAMDNAIAAYREQNHYSRQS